MERGVGYIKWIEVDSGEVSLETFDDLDRMCFELAQFHAWNDLDDSYEIEEAVWEGKKVRYAGWQPGMQFDFYIDNELIWRNWFPNWDH